MNDHTHALAIGQACLLNLQEIDRISDPQDAQGEQFSGRTGGIIETFKQLDFYGDDAKNTCRNQRIDGSGIFDLGNDIKGLRTDDAPIQTHKNQTVTCGMNSIRRDNGSISLEHRQIVAAGISRAEFYEDEDA
jgi:hypothetical protein